MKKCFAMLLLCCLLAGCQTPIQMKQNPVQPTLNPESGLKQWSTTDYSLVLTYPHTWFASTDIPAIVQLLSPLTDATPDYREYIIIGVQEADDTDTAQSVADAAFTEMQALFPTVALTQSDTATVGGITMQRRVFGGEILKSDIGPDGDYIWHQYAWLSGGLSYSITFSGMADTIEQYLPVFQYVLDNMVLNFQ